MGLALNTRERPHSQAVHRLSRVKEVEKFYYLETSSNGLKDFLKCRTVGLCITHNRLLNCHVVRSTKPVHYIDPVFILARDKRMPREETHLAKYPSYPACWRNSGYTKHTSRRVGCVAPDSEYVCVCVCVRARLLNCFPPTGPTFLLYPHCKVLLQARETRNRKTNHRVNEWAC